MPRTFTVFDGEEPFGDVVVVRHLEADEVFSRLQDYLEDQAREMERLEIFPGGVWQGRLVQLAPTGPTPTQAPTQDIRRGGMQQEHLDSDEEAAPTQLATFRLPHPLPAVVLKFPIHLSMEECVEKVSQQNRLAPNDSEFMRCYPYEATCRMQRSFNPTNLHMSQKKV